MACILVILPSTHSHTGMLMQMVNSPLLKIKKKERLQKLVGMDPAEIVVPFINAEIDSLWTQHELW